MLQIFLFILGNVPCPIVYGAVVDSACLVWEYACGERGACWLYDSNVFRMFYHGMRASVIRFPKRMRIDLVDLSRRSPDRVLNCFMDAFINIDNFSFLFRN